MLELLLTLTDISGSSHSPNSPVTFTLVQSVDTPVDSFRAVFLYEELFSREMAYLEVSLDSIPLLSGIVDEQEILTDANGKWVTLLCRSRAALLLDNEALPGQSLETSARSIFERHVRPYGFFSMEADERAPLPSFLVAKGESELDVLIRFCQLSGYPAPRFPPSNRLTLKRPVAGAKFLISNRQGGAIPFLSLARVTARHTCISEILLKNQDGIYVTSIQNPEALTHGIQRRRYLNPASEWAFSPDRDAQMRIRDSLYNRKTVEATLAGFTGISLYDTVILEESGIEEFPYTVTGVKLSRSAQGDITTLCMTQEQFLPEEVRPIHVV